MILNIFIFIKCDFSIHFFENTNKESYLKIYWAVEERDGRSRSAGASVFDIYENEVIHLTRRLKTGCLCFLASQSMEVSTPTSTAIGCIQFKYSTFVIKNMASETVLSIRGNASFDLGNAKFKVKITISPLFCLDRAFHRRSFSSHFLVCI